MIVRDEEDNIKEALTSILPIADEIIINDTGSKDKTIDIISEFCTNGKVRLVRSIWEDDFSKARNISLSYATYGWIIWLDADDRIPTEMVDSIRKLAVQSPLDRCFTWCIRNKRTDGLRGGPEFWQTRMFPNHESIRFRKRVHECATKSLEEMGIEKRYVDVHINHLGYSDPAKKTAKATRNLKLQLAEPCCTPLKYSLLAQTFTILKEWDRAIYNFLKCWNTPDLKTLDPDLYFTTPSEIGRCHMKKGDFKTALEWFETSDSKNIEAAYQKARCLEELKQYEKAIWTYYHVLSLPKAVKRISIEYHACRIYTFHFLLRLLVVMGHHGKAVSLVHKMVEQYPDVKSDPSDLDSHV